MVTPHPYSATYCRTVCSFVGLILRLTAQQSVLGNVTFKYQFFFNLLLPPIILASGYELHQGRFFRHIGTILTFAFAGTFISALVLGFVIYLWALLPIESMRLTFVDAISVGATLSATDPVTILAIFNTYRVDPKLYTTIFGESILNDAIAIVLFETAQRYSQYSAEVEEGEVTSGLTPIRMLESVGIFLLVFTGSLVIGIVIGVATSVLLKFTYVRRFPKIESCIVLLIAYASYFFANAIHMSGIVSLLFCGICLKHYAYHNMSRRTQLTIKFIFQILAQLSENFIFIYLGLSLFTETDLVFKPGFIIITCLGICASRWMAVFPLSSVINWFNRWRHRRSGRTNQADDVMPWSYQAMLFWAGLRGAVGVALAAGLSGPNKHPLKATVLVVVILTVIIFGGTTARMLEILNIRTGVVEDVDSDDEFDIEVVKPGSSYTRRSGNGFGHNPKASYPDRDNIALDTSPTDGFIKSGGYSGGYSSGNARTPPPGGRPSPRLNSRNNSSLRVARESDYAAQAAQGLLAHSELNSDDEDVVDDLGLPPAARRPNPNPISPNRSRGVEAPSRTTSAPPGVAGAEEGGAGTDLHPESGHIGKNSNAGRAQGFRQFLSGSTEDPATWFRHLDEGFIKPRLLLDPKDGSNSRPGDDRV
ncbi:MAG: hypothetical protein Q9162_000470 [Coniocarpon cinnabarinum]